MKACSIPIQTVIGTKSCWFGFLHWFIVADNKATPDNSLADSEPLRFSPYLYNVNNQKWINEIYTLFLKTERFSLRTVTMDPEVSQ